ncbi:transcription factor DIVARICATA-like [Lycium barbarum]|uniref:transcription factor DIVARICATA-like n=1 Tax=Lycium barbarum TaxID=112863 RepID=UPI00293E5D11|nr:transcription factor DIVARICATA-like [Lycium barbarum]
MSTWTREDNKLFEEGLVLYPENIGDRWQLIADHVPGKTQDDIVAHYEDLVHDVCDIDSGRIELPSYTDDDPVELDQVSFGSNNKKNCEIERKKGTPWTEEEHRLFLIGLDKYGKGDWRSISRNVVISRTPTQVASHAQKYFIRQQAMKKERKRSSIHDITTAVDTNAVPPQSSFQNQRGSQNFNFTM